MRLEGEAAQRPLVGSLGIESMASDVSQAANTDPQLYSVIVADNTDRICQETRDAIWYPHYTTKINGEIVRPTIYPGIEQLDNLQVASSYGFVLVASQLMERAEIPHFITYVNGHATILGVTGENSIRLADPLSPELNFDATLSMNTPELIAEMDATIGGKYSIYFDTRKMALALDLNWNQLAAEHPWVSAGSYLKRGSTSNHKVVATAYYPEIGRNVLVAHSKFLKYITERNFVDAAIVLDGMGNLYPEVDLRQRHSEIKLLSRRLAENGLVDLARLSVTRYVGSIASVAADPRAEVLKGDCLRMIATVSGDERSAADAIEAYEDAKKVAAHGLAYISGKIRKAQAVAARVAA